jgi:hypothetical protein
MLLITEPFILVILNVDTGEYQMTLFKNFCSVETLFSNMKPPTCATSPPLGDGAH